MSPLCRHGPLQARRHGLGCMSIPLISWCSHHRGYLAMHMGQECRIDGIHLRRNRAWRFLRLRIAMRLGHRRHGGRNRLPH